MAITVAMRTQVTQLYVAMFGRAPDAEGLAFWVKALDNGMSLSNLAQQMYNTAPSRAYYPEFATSQEIVATFYQYVLGRPADAEGLAFWVRDLNAAPSKGAFFTKILNNVINYTGTDAAGLKSQALFLNKVEVAQYYGEKDGSIVGATVVLDGVTEVAGTVIAAKAAIDGAAAAGQTFMLTAGFDQLIGGNRGGATDDIYLGTAENGFISNGTQSTFNPGDAIDGGTGSNTLRLFMGQGATADGVAVSNIQTLDLRLNANTRIYGGEDSNLAMTDWDDSLEQINIRSNKSSIDIIDQQVIADISISDQSTATGYSGYGFNYAAGVVDGVADGLSVTLDNVNGSGGAWVGIDDGIEQLDLTVADRAGSLSTPNRYASDVNLTAEGVTELTVDAGRAGQTFTLSANIADGANFDSTAFAGNMVLDSANIETAAFGAGSDTATLSGEADSEDASYNMGEGDNNLTLNVAFAGEAMSGAGADTITATSTSNGSSIAAGNGANTVTVIGAHAGAITGGTGVDTVTAGSTADTGTIDVGAGNNVVTTGAHAGDIDAGAGDDRITVTTTAAGSDIRAGAGNNTIVATAHAGNIQTTDGNDTVTVASTASGSSINVGDGTNTVAVSADHEGSIVAGSGTDTVTIGDDMLTGSSIAVGNGNGNKITVSGDVIDDADDTLKNTSILVGNGNANTVEIDGSVTNSTITFGNGNDNTLEIGGDLSADAPGTVTFGTGDNKSLTVGGDIINESVVMGTGSGSDITVDGDVTATSITVAGETTTLTVEGDIDDGSIITLGNGSNTVTANYIDHSAVTMGSGADSLTLQDGVYTSNIQMGDGADQLTLGANEDTSTAVGYWNDDDLVKTVVNMGAGNDSVVLKSIGGNLDDDYGYVYTNGFVEGGAGTDTLTFEAEDSAKLIGRDLTQIAEVDVRKTGGAVYAVGDVVAVKFTRGTEIFTVSYTVVAADFLQGPDSVAVNVAQNLEAKLNLDIDFGDHFDAEASGGVISIESAIPHEDFVIESTQAKVTVLQNSDARITSFETLNLVALETEGSYLEINANFDMIDGTNKINLDSQLVRVSYVEDEDKNGDYTTFESGGKSTFTLQNLQGGEAITVKGSEVTATGNQQVTQIAVGTEVGNYLVGDKITLSIGESQVVYTVSAADLNKDTAVLDASNIAASLQFAIASAAAEAGLAVTRDDNQITLVGQAGQEVMVSAVQTRTEVTNIDQSDFATTLDDQTTWALTNALDGNLEAGDVVTITIGSAKLEFTVSEDDCLRHDAKAIFDTIEARFGAAAVSFDWGTVNFADSASISVKRTQEIDQFSTTVENDQDASATDDADYDVYINATLEEGASDTGMDLTVAGNGDFDIAITGGDNSGYTDLDLKLGDTHDHTIDTFGYFSVLAPIPEASGNFTETITVSDVANINTTGSNIALENVVAHTVTSTSKANLTIDQYAIREDGEVSVGETIKVTTGSGNDHLTTYAPSVLADGGSINLGSGDNHLSLGWGVGETLDSSDLESIGDIDFSGQLHQLDILNDVVLNAENTLLTMPGGVNAVETVTFTDLSSDDDNVVESLTIAGVANDVQIVSDQDFFLGFSISDASSFRDSAVTLGAGVVTVMGNLDSETDNYYGSDMYKFTHGGGELTITSDDDFSTNLFILDETGLVIGGWDTSQINLELDAGVYYVVIGENNIDAYATEEDFENDDGGIYDNDWGYNDGEDVGTADLVAWDDGPNDETASGTYELTFSVETAGSSQSSSSIFNENSLSTNNFVGDFTATDSSGDEITGDMSIEAGGTVRFNLGNNTLELLDVNSGSSSDVYIAERSDQEVDIGSVVLISGEDANLHITTNTGSSIDLGSTSLTSGFEPENHDFYLNVDNNSESAITLGAVNMLAQDADANLVIDRNTESSVEMSTLTMETECDVEVLVLANTESDIVVTGNVEMSGDNWTHFEVSDNAGSNVNFASEGEMTLNSDYSVFLEIDSNTNTNVALAEGGDLNLTACDDSAAVDIKWNNNNHQPTGSGPDAVGQYQSFVIELGNLTMDADNYVSLDIYGNEDETFFGDLTVKIGDISMVTYAGAELNVGEDYDMGGDAWGANWATTVEMGNVDVLAKDDVYVELSNNYGTMYDLGNIYSEANRYQQDNAVITMKDVTLTSDFGGVFVDVEYNELAVIEIGNMDAVAHGSTSSISFEVNDNVSTTFLSGDISLVADGDGNDVDSYQSAYFSFYGNTDRNELAGEQFIVNTYTVDGHLTLEATDTAQVDIAYNDGAYGDEYQNLEITVTGNTSVNAGDEFASVEIYYNDYTVVNLDGKTTVESTNAYAEVWAYENDATDITIGGDVSITSTNDSAYVTLTDNDTSDIFFEGQVTLVSSDLAQLEIDNNDSSTIELVDSTVAVAPLDAAPHFDVNLTSRNSDAVLIIRENDNSDVTIGDVMMSAFDDAEIYIQNNDRDSSYVSIGDMDVTAEDALQFDVSGQDGWNLDYWAEIEVAAQYDADADEMTRGTIVLSGGYVGDYDGSLGVNVNLNNYTSVELGDFDITATDSDVNVNLDTGNENDIATGSFTIAAMQDVYFMATDNGLNSSLSVGDITITAGNDANAVGATIVSSDVYFFADDVSTSETGASDAQSITITALSKGVGEGNVYVDITDAYDLESLTVSGTNAEIYLDGNIGSGDFTLDLSGMTGAFDAVVPFGIDFAEAGAYYDPLGEDSSSNREQDGGTFVSTIDADFDGDVTVKVGTGDMIYNAQHSAFGGSSGDWEYNGTNDSFDWNGDEGWFSLGYELDLVPTVAGQSFYLSGVSGDPTGSSNDLYQINSVIFDTGEREFAAVMDYYWDDSGDDRGWYYSGGSSTVNWYELGGATWEEVSVEEVEAALGSDVQITVTAGSDSSSSVLDTLISIAGAADGTDFNFIDTAVRDYGQDDSALEEALMGSAVGFDVSTTVGDEANDGLGNAASETFEFNADGIGEVIIGGFRANGFFEDAEVDRLDFSALADIDSAADLIITIENGDGYFDDIIIDFVNDDYGSVRLVGVGEYFTDLNVNGIANSIIFA